MTLSLEWVECRRKMCSFERVPRRLFTFLLLLCNSYLKSEPFQLNAVKHWIFRKSAAALIAFRFKRCQGYSGGAVSIKCFFSSCVVPESVGFVSWSVCVRVQFWALALVGERGCGDASKGYFFKNSGSVPWRETYHGKNINEWLRQRKHPGGGHSLI